MDGGYGSVTIVHDARSPEDVFQDFCGRRSGIVKALTIEVEKFYKQCDPGQGGRDGSTPDSADINMFLYFAREGELVPLWTA
ncbi:hypothetical protein OsI_16047 [Oryza sativa Indica Group]|uniref:Alfin N-terminal domain-containing protein n=1 Tax=Oryza sativa subsp. indica TaxID=39946 RepID=B8AUC5_ORYSI|nr:hypothetical protein OsI_16047 [Oryza sativa Indica Group]